jgi:hypothetical protein
MGRAWRIILLGITTFSTLLLIATTGLWIQSIGWPYVISRTRTVVTGGATLKGSVRLDSDEFYSMRGGLDIRHYRYPSAIKPTELAWSSSRVSMPMRLNQFPSSTSNWNRLGFFYQRGVPGGSIFVGIPYWFVMAITALLPAAIAIGKWNRSRAVIAGRCPTCGYDLRATPRRCPECGTVVGR